MNQEQNKGSMLHIGSADLVRVSNSISIINKILFSDIEEQFNKAFYLLNSKNLPETKENYLVFFECTQDYRNKNIFKFEAKQESHYQESIALFSDVIKIKPKHALSYEFRGIAKTRILDDQGAIDDLSIAINMGSSNKDAYFFRGEARRMHLIDTKGAIDDFSKSLSYDPLHVEAYVSLGIVNEKLKGYTAAIEEYTKALDIDNQKYFAFYRRGCVHAQLGNYAEAILDYNRAIDINPNYNYYWDRAKARQMQKDYMGAIADFTKSLELINANKPTEYANYFGSGKSKFAMEDYEGAIADYTLAIQYAESHEVYIAKAKALFKQKAYAEAIQDISKAMEFDPSQANDYCLRGYIHYVINEVGAAIQDYTIAIELNPDFPNPYYLRSIARKHIGDDAGANKDEDFFQKLKAN